LGERREQWAARYTWAYFTAGIHSTQRSEAIHSAVAGWCTNNSLFTELVQQLDKYASQKTLEDEAKTRERVLLAACNKAPIQACVRDGLLPALTQHAAEHVKAQAALSMTYRIKEMPCSSETPLSERKWKVTYTPPLGSSADPGSSSASATDEHARHYNQQSDNGLVEDDKYICHVCSLRDCSCQLPSSLKLPCRHQVWAAHIVSMTERVILTPADFDISPMWLKAENTDMAKDAALRALMEMEARLPSGRCAPEPTPRMTRAERVQYAMNLVRPSVELAALNEADYEFFCKTFGGLQRTLSARARLRRDRPELGGAAGARAAAPSAEAAGPTPTFTLPASRRGSGKQRQKRLRPVHHGGSRGSRAKMQRTASEAPVVEPHAPGGRGRGRGRGRARGARAGHGGPAAGCAEPPHPPVTVTA